MTDKLKRYFNGEMDPSEELDFQQWLAAHSEDPEVIRAMSGLFDEAVPASLNDESVESSLQSLEKRLGLVSAESKHRKTRIFRLSLIMTAVCACLGVVVLLSYRMGRNAAAVEILPGLEKAVAEADAAKSVVWKEVKVPNGGIDTLTLSDGSLLCLNSGSRVTYPSAFEGEERRVFVDGEVYADIAKDPSRPFFVQSGDVTLKVLGTTFNFKAYEDSHCVETMLLEGSVQMDISSSFGSRQILMNPGNIVQFDRRDGNVEIRDFQPSLYKSFAESRALHFYNITIEDIAADLERVFSTKVVVMDEKLAHTRIFAIFTNNESLAQILSAMNRDRKMTINWRDGVVYLASSK